ncbi:MAG: endonuclease III domain-containing protein [Terriglobia bacterium]
MPIKQGEVAPGEILPRFYATLLESFGPQGWWPARTRWEVIWGAILTQNTTWRNATLALNNLRKAGLLAWRPLRQAPLRELEQSIRPAGFYRQKARTLHDFAHWIGQAHGGSLDSLFSLDLARARAQLLALKGIGAETADAILLYSGRRPVFVADAYTRRVLSRHQFLSPTADYASAQQFLHRHLPADEAMYNEFHALLVEAAKRYCHRNVAHCEECPLGKFLEGNSKLETRNSARYSGSDSRVSVLV